MRSLNFSRHEKSLLFAYVKTKCADQLCTAHQCISFRYIDRIIVQSLYFLNPKFQASSYFVWLYSRFCVRPGWKSWTGFLMAWLIFFQHFNDPEEARQAAENLDNAPFEGINLKVEVCDLLKSLYFWTPK